MLPNVWISEDKVVFNYLNLEDSILFLVYLCPSNKPTSVVWICPLDPGHFCSLYYSGYEVSQGREVLMGT